MMLDYEQSFSCNTQRNITMNVANVSSLPHNISAFYNVTIMVKSFRVQAFHFDSDDDHLYGTGESKFIPIVFSLTK